MLSPTKQQKGAQRHQGPAGDRLTQTQWAGASLVAVAVLAIGVVESIPQSDAADRDDAW
jgi:hypothetical protein